MKAINFDIVLLALTVVTLFIGVAWVTTVNAAPAQQQVQAVYSKTLLPATIATELGLPILAVQDYSETVADCTITFAAVLRTDTDQTFDRQGNVIASRQRQVTTLEPWQQRRLDELMRSRGCYRLTR